MARRLKCSTRPKLPHCEIESHEPLVVSLPGESRTLSVEEALASDAAQLP